MSTPYNSVMKRVEGPPPERIDTSAHYVATFFTERGVMEFDLFARESPRLVNNFIYLCTQGFYDGTRFHRVVEDFVVQGGGQGNTGEGGPGYFLSDEFAAHSHKAGILSLSNSGPDTNGSHFFIALVDMPWLDGIHCPMGELAKGDAVLRIIKQRDLLEKIRIKERGARALADLTWSHIVSEWEKAVHNQKDKPSAKS